MNFTKRGIRKQEKALLGHTEKLYHKFSVLVFHVVIIAAVAAIAIGAALGIGAFRGVLSAAPDISGITVTPRGYSTFVYDSDGNQIAKLVSQDSNRIPVTMDMIPKHLQQAFVAIEDERFYTHNGIDIYGIIRAGFEGITSGDFSQGASTITQQLLKNNVFTDWIGQEGFAKWKRKFQEQFLAIELEKNMSKEDILLNYMNTINLGQNTLGVQAASLRYFGKSVSELTLSESACIAGITQNPSGYNPISYPEENEKRRARVLGNMKDQGMISQEEYDKAMADDVYSRIQLVNAEQEGTDVTSYFVDALTVQLKEDLMDLGYNETQAFTLMYSSGLKIYSTQDPKIQRIADEIVQDPENYTYTLILLSYALTVEKPDGSLENHSQEMLETYFKQFNVNYNRLYNTEEDAYAAVEEYKAAVLQEGDKVFDERISLTLQPQTSVVIADQSNGHVVAMVGGRGPKEASRTLNRASDTTRQPGSTFKVVSTYAPALDDYGMSLATTINDAPFAYDNGRLVRNWWGQEYRGMYSLRNAIKDSANVVTVKTLTWITPQLGYEYLQRFGFTTLVEQMRVGDEIYSDITQSLALGGITQGVKNVELNAAYAAIANGGVYVKPTYYTHVTDNQNNVIIDYREPGSQLNRRVLKETTAYLLTSAMKDVVTWGNGANANFGTTAVAGKTGTTSDDRDSWFSGYTRYYTCTVWVGYDNNEVLPKTDMATKLWGKIMGQVHEGKEYLDFIPPAEGLTSAAVCGVSGKLPVGGMCDGHVRTELFEIGTVPTATCDQHFKGNICRATKLQANTHCPFAVEEVSVLPPIEPDHVARGSQAGNRTDVAGAETEVIVDENGQQQVVRKKCNHDATFWTLPESPQTLYQQSYNYFKEAGADDALAREQATNFSTEAFQRFADSGQVFNLFRDTAPPDPNADPNAAQPDPNAAQPDPNAAQPDPNAAQPDPDPAAGGGEGG